MHALRTAVRTGCVLAALGAASAQAQGITPWQNGTTAAQSCTDMPRPAAGEVFAVVFGKTGAALSNVTVERVKPEPFGGNPDRLRFQEAAASYGAVVDVEPGPGKVFLILSAKSSTVFQFTGATDRLSSVVIDGAFTGSNSYPGNNYTGGGNGPAHGVIGLPKEKVHFTANWSCVASVLLDRGEYGGDRMLADLEQRFGRRPDLMVGVDKIQKASLPSGNVVSPPRRMMGSGMNEDPTSVLRMDLEREYPAGSLNVRASDILARYPLVTHAVPPGTAGILKLIEDGSVTIDRYKVQTSPSSWRSPIEIRFRKQVDFPYPAVGGGMMSQARFVFEPGIKPSGPAWGYLCVLTDGGATVAAGEDRCRQMGLVQQPQAKAQ